MAIEKPTLILDGERARRNIERMADKARKSGVRFRPHFKTHQSAQIAEWFRDVGVEVITVSSVDMGVYFATHGWRDITVAFPVNVREIGKIVELAESVELGLLVESTEAVLSLRERLGTSVALWIKIDVGYGRAGIAWDQLDRVLGVADQIDQAELLSLRGILTHSGHAYQTKSKEGIRSIYRETVLRMTHVRDGLRAKGWKNLQLSVGDTPTCTVVEDFGEVDEVRPGNFVFYDVMQLELGVCSEDDIAVAVACPIVATHEEKNEVVVYGGAVHLSKESLTGEDGARVFGRVALPTRDGWGPQLPGAYVSALSQEHGVIHLGDEALGEVHVGDILMVLPVHSCLTANLLKRYVTLDGETIEAMGAP